MGVLLTQRGAQRHHTFSAKSAMALAPDSSLMSKIMTC